MIALALAACTPIGFSERATSEQLRARAAHDFKCPEEQVKTVTIDDRTRSATGCGQQGTFIESCAVVNKYGEKEDSTWVFNSETNRRSRDGQ